MGNSLIRWRLREVMDENGIQGKALADALGISQNAVSNLRSSNMPRIDGDRLNQLLLHLNKMRRQGTEIISPSDLIEFSLTPTEMSEIGV